MIQFGIALPNYGAETTRLTMIDSAVAAERMGFDSVWLTDHLALPTNETQQYGHIFEAVTSMAFLAASTRKIKLGVSTLVLPQRNPVEIAKQISTIDHLSNGRVLFTAGIGWSEAEYQNLGYNFKDRGKRMDEALRLLRTCWRGQTRINFKGKYHQIENMAFSPPPIQPGGPPLWVAGNSIHALKRAVLLGDGWHPNAFNPDEMRSLLDQVQPLINNRPFSIAIRFRINFEADASENALTGSDAQIIQQLKTYQELGMNTAVLNFTANNQLTRERAMQKFIRDIKPALG